MFRMKSIYIIWVLAITLMLILSVAGTTTAKEKKQVEKKPVEKPEQKTAPVAEEKQITLPAEPTLDDYLLYAEKKNQGLKELYYRWQAALQRIPQVTALPNPQVSYQAELRVGIQRNTLGVSQPFPYPGRLRQEGAVANSEALIMKQEYDSFKYYVFGKIKKAYFEYEFLAQEIKIAEENVKLMEHFIKLVETKLAVGKADQATLLKAYVELDKMNNELASMKNMRTPIVVQLNTVLDRPADSELPWPKVQEKKFLSVDDEQFFKWLSEKAPELLIADKRINRSQEMLKLTAFENKPNFMVGLGFDNNVRSVMGRDRNDVTVMFQMEIPIWKKKIQARKEEARLDLAAERTAKLNVENDIKSKLSMMIYGLRDAQRRYDLYIKSLLPKAEQSLKASEVAFATGKLEFLDLLESQRVLLMFRMSSEQAYRDYKKSTADIEELTGISLEELMKPATAGKGLENQTKKEQSEKKGE